MPTFGISCSVFDFLPEPTAGGEFTAKKKGEASPPKSVATDPSRFTQVSTSQLRLGALIGAGPLPPSERWRIRDHPTGGLSGRDAMDPVGMRWMAF